MERGCEGEARREREWGERVMGGERVCEGREEDGRVGEGSEKGEWWGR